MCSPIQETHIRSDMCSSTWETHITGDVCSPTWETHTTSDMCSPTQETHITSDMCLPALSSKQLYIWVIDLLSFVSGNNKRTAWWPWGSSASYWNSRSVSQSYIHLTLPLVFACRWIIWGWGWGWGLGEKRREKVSSHLRNFNFVIEKVDAKYWLPKTKFGNDVITVRNWGVTGQIPFFPSLIAPQRD